MKPTATMTWLFAVTTLLGASVVPAQTVGNIATMEGTVEIGRAGTWTPATPGATVEQGDVLRTGRPGRVRVVLPDNSVLKLGDGSELVMSEQVYDPAHAQGGSVVNVVRGKVRAIVSDYYKQPTTHFRVQTATAVSGVRGTDFIVAYDESADVTQVVGVTGNVAVTGVGRQSDAPVIVSGRQMTSVARDGFPTPIQRAGDEVFKQFLDGVEFTGQGGPESLTSTVTDGSQIAPADRLASGSTLLTGGGPMHAFTEDGFYPPDAAGLIDQPPGAVGLGELSIPF